MYLLDQMALRLNSKYSLCSSKLKKVDALITSYGYPVGHYSHKKISSIEIVQLPERLDIFSGINLHAGQNGMFVRTL